MEPDSEVAKQPEENGATIRLFSQRHERQKQATWLSITVILLPACILFYLDILQVKFDPRYFEIILFAAAAPPLLSIFGIILFSQSNWRCPACNRYLRVLHPFQTPDSLFCPYCATKLR